MRVVWDHTTNYATKAPGEEQTWEVQYSIYRAAAEPERMSGDADFLAFLNTLGADGWELISESIQNSTIVSGSGGWPDAGVPTRVVWTFKRPLESVSPQ